MSQLLFDLTKRRRWLKRLCKPWLGDVAEVSLKKLRLAVDPQDERGPSFHISFGGEAGFAHYELPQKTEALRWLPAQGGVYCDLGANVGPIAFSLKCSRPDLRIHAFEAHPNQARLFQATVEWNGLKDVRLEAVAVGREKGEVRLYLDETDFGGHSVFRESCWNNRAEPEALCVPMTSLDRYFDQVPETRIDVIKMDVQGAENDALWGATATLRRFRPVILVEGENQRILLDGDLVQPLQSLSVPYQVKELGSETLLPLSELPRLAEQGREKGAVFSDYVFVPER